MSVTHSLKKTFCRNVRIKSIPDPAQVFPYHLYTHWPYYYSTLHSTTPYFTTLHNTNHQTLTIKYQTPSLIELHITPCNTTPHRTIPYHTILYYTSTHYTLFHTIPNTKLCHATVYHTTSYQTPRDDKPP